MIRRPQKTKISNKGPEARTRNLPAPVGGWNTRDSQARMRPEFALYLENLFPTAKTVDMRKGSVVHATGLPLTGKHLMAWVGPTSTKVFACTDGGIYDVTTAGAVGASVSTLTDGRCIHINFNATGGSFLVVVNGVDQLRYYNGSTWTLVPTFTIGAGPSTLASTDISYINSFKRALFFIKKQSMSFYYLPVDQITGSVSVFPLGAIFSKGGYLVAMANWTFDGGVGLDDYTVFASSQGQLAVYKGTDPSSSTTWALQGVYDLGSPLGARCFTKYGGDLLFLSTTGLWSMSKALVMSQDKDSGTVSSVINEAFSSAASSYGSQFGWQIAVCPTDNLLVVNVPITQFVTSHQYVMNINTKAWTKFTNWNASSFELVTDQLYMTVGTTVVRCWEGGLDSGNSITAYAKCAPQYLAPASSLKQIQLVKLTMTVEGVYAMNADVDMDFRDDTDYQSPVFSGIALSYWNTGTYGDAEWGALPDVTRDWFTVTSGEGYAAAPRLRIISRDATIQWSAIDYAYVAGAIQG